MQLRSIKKKVSVSKDCFSLSCYGFSCIIVTGIRCSTFLDRTVDKKDPENCNYGPYVFIANQCKSFSFYMFFHINCISMGTKHSISEGASIWIHDSFSFTEGHRYSFFIQVLYFYCNLSCCLCASYRKQKMCSILLFCTPLKK